MDRSQQPIHSGDHALREALWLLSRAQSLVAHVLASKDQDTDLPAEDQELLRAINEYNEAQDLAVPDQPGVSANVEMHQGVPLEEFDVSQDERIRRQNSFTQYERNQDCFTAPQWEVICPYFREGLNDEQIAVLLDISRSAVWYRRSRAKERLETRMQDLEQKRLNFASKFIKA